MAAEPPIHRCPLHAHAQSASDFTAHVQVFISLFLPLFKSIGEYTVKKVHEFPVCSRDVTNQTPPGQE